MDKKISVIIPIYNSEKYLRQTIDSVRCQTYGNLEIICVLDCPTDNSAAIVDDAAIEDRRIKIIRNLKNVKQAVSRNTGVENATGEYIHFMDADDLINPRFYEAMLDAVVNADANIAVCSAFHEKRPKQSILFSKYEILLGQNKIKRTDAVTQGWAWRYLIKKSFWNDRNLSFPDLAPVEDMPVILPMVFYANKIAACPDAMYFYKYRETSSLNEELNNEREQLRNTNWQKADRISRDFRYTHKIKRNNKLHRSRYRRAGRTVCINDPVEYGKTDTKISVIIPIYNAEKYLKQTLDSIRFQTYKNLEIICVLDCPTDNSAAIVENAAKEDDRIKAVRHSQNMGLPAARNTGVKNAVGEYIHFIDSDDLISPDFYDVMISAAAKANADVAACSVFYEKKPAYSIWFKRSDVLSFTADKIEISEVALHGWAWRYLIKSDFWNRRNLSFPDLVPMEDKPAMIPMIHYANRVVLCPGAVYFYKNREVSILNKSCSSAQKKRRHDNRQKAREIIRDFVNAEGVKLPNRLLRLIQKRFA